MTGVNRRKWAIGTVLKREISLNHRAFPLIQNPSLLLVTSFNFTQEKSS